MKDDSHAWHTEDVAGYTAVNLPHVVTRDNFVSGDQSGYRFRTQFFRHDETQALLAKVTFGEGTQGPPGHAHGGSMAALLDETMGGAGWMAGHTVLAVELTSRFKNMLAVGTHCIVHARVTKVQGRKVWTTAEVRDRDNDTLYCEGEALFIVVSAEKLGALAEHASKLTGRPA